MQALRSEWRLIADTVRRHWRRWLLMSFGFMAAYYALLVAAMIVRFEQWPNYLNLYDILDSYRLILVGTPDLRDAIPIMADEIWLEIGYMNPQYNIAEWSFNLLPAKMAVVFLMGALLATLLLLAMSASRRSCPTPGAMKGSLATTAGTGSFLVGLGSATLSWVVCCATPSWVVALAMMGLGASVSLALEPLGVFLNLAGVVLLAGAVHVQARRSLDSGAFDRPVPAQ